MEVAEIASAGYEAFLKEEYQLAKEKYTEAIQCEPENPIYYLKRSICNAKLEDFSSSECDATKAVQLDKSESEAYLRQGIARFQLKKYTTAKESFDQALNLNPQNEDAQNWIKKCEVEIQLLVKAEMIAEVEAIAKKSEKPNLPTVRQDWYQTETNVVLCFLVKNCKKDDVDVEFGPQTLNVDVKLPAGDNYQMQLELANAIVVEESITKILSTKIEVKLKKAEGIRWTSLERQDGKKYATLKASEPLSSESSARQYPSSSSKFHDWDKLAAKLEEDEKEDKEEGEGAMNQLFKKIYADADEDTRRAMNKSYQESGGTVLSTNWKDIGSKKVECKPPDGMEFKKYEY